MGDATAVDRDAAEAWIGAYVEPAGAIELLHDEPWAAVLRVPVRDGVVWFKECRSVQAFEPALTAALYARWPDRIAEVLAWDEKRAWLLLADAGAPIGAFTDIPGAPPSGNMPEDWERALPLYAELQRGETAHAAEHLARGVPDLRVDTLPARYEAMLARNDLPVDAAEIERLRRFAPRFAELCAELAARGIPDSIQHDDLHLANVYEHDGRYRILDWGDSSVAHPFETLVVTFEHVELTVPAGDPWYARLRDAYLEPWGEDLVDTFELAFRVGTIAHVVANVRQLDHLPPGAVRDKFPRRLAEVVRRAPTD